jgi:hypothetical protein
LSAVADAFLKSIELPPARDGEPRNGYPWTLPAGGSSSFGFATRASHSQLSSAIRLMRSGRRARTDFFLRAPGRAEQLRCW